VGAY
jgi:hypothetical protein